MPRACPTGSSSRAPARAAGRCAERRHPSRHRQLDIIDGTLSYTYPLTGKTIKAEQVKATASVGSLKGPFSIDGNATVNGVPLSLAVSVHAPRDDGANDAKLVVKVPSGHLTFDGRTSAIAPDATISGHLQVTTGGLTDFISALVRAIGEPLPAFDTSVVGSFAFDGGIEISPSGSRSTTSRPRSAAIRRPVRWR